MNNEQLISNFINGAVAIGTLSLAYMSYRQIKDANAKVHMADLRELTDKCLNLLPIIQKAESTKYSYDSFSTYQQDSPELSSYSDRVYIPPLLSIENDAFFEDLLHHFPNLRYSWNRFRPIKDYDEIRKILIKKIGEYVNEKKNYSNIDFNLKLGFPLSVYMEIVNILKGENSGYNYEITYKNTTPVDKRVSLYYSIEGNGYPLADMENDKLEDVKKFHTDIIRECKTQFNEDIKIIIETEKKLINIRQELKSELENITHCIYPPKMDCRYVKFNIY